METLWPLADLAPALGAAALLGFLVLRIWRQAAVDREGHAREISRIYREHASHVQELMSQHSQEIIRLRGEIEGMAAVKSKLRADLEEARRQRWRAEDAAAQYRRRLGLPEESPEDGS